MKSLSVIVCALLSLGRAAHLVKRAASCPAGWTEFDGRCFRYFPGRMTWADSEKYCETQGANLASVHNANEYHHIQFMIRKATHGFGRTWLGGSDCQKEGIWLWTDGTPFDYRECGKFDNRWWKQHCLQMNYGGNKCWDDVQCSSKLPSVCAKKAK
ncbi:galactose-specific lectin nattectin-like [Mugil cephalus]|uniref:galactose-specific lectin nattectin-like n=1 Tax=Mugil cephalus TaxID=48193 RepID=UPI001FB5FF4C|nr:galactose-specific lectin nattectin-like [Mugil cephalus]